MSVRRHSMSLNLDRLTAQEQDLLRLLAQGHTAKTIANLTGLSVNSVNERLRSARRKTGAVSSRELARRLADQTPQPPQEIRPKLIRYWPPDARAALVRLGSSGDRQGQFVENSDGVRSNFCGRIGGRRHQQVSISGCLILSTHITARVGRA